MRLAPALSFAALSLYLALSRLWAGNAGYFDLGIMEHIAWGVAQGDFGKILLGHVRPVFLLIGLIYKIFPRTEALLILGSLGLGAFVFLAGKLREEVSLLVALAPAAWFAALFDFHPDALFPLVAVLAIISLEKGKKLPFALWSLAGLLLKDSLGVPVAFLGLAAALRGWRRVGLAVAAAGLGWTALCHLVILPAAGGGFSSMMGPPFLNAQKLNYLLFLWLNAPLAPLAPAEALGALSHWLVALFSHEPAHLSLTAHYGAQALPFLAWATGKALKRRPQLLTAALRGVFLAQVIWGPFGLNLQNPRHPFNAWVFRGRSPRWEFLENLPPGKLTGQIDLLVGPAVRRRWVRPFPEGLGEAELVLLDTATGRWVGMRLNPEGYRRWTSKVSNDPSWKVLKEDGSLLLLQRTQNPSPETGFQGLGGLNPE